MTLSNSKNYWIVEMHLGKSSYYCPTCYTMEGKKIYMRILPEKIEHGTQCPGCSIEVNEWIKQENL